MSGQSVIRIVKKVCPEIVAPEMLSDIDIEVILLAARIQTFGPKLSMNTVCSNPEVNEDGTLKCPSAEKGEPFKVDIDLNEFIMRYVPIDEGEMNLFELSLPKARQHVKLRPPPYESSLIALREIAKMRNDFSEMGDFAEESLFDVQAMEKYFKMLDQTYRTNLQTLAKCIRSVRSHSGTEEGRHDIILKWIEKLPISDADLISKALAEISIRLAGPSQIEVPCPDCGYMNKVMVQLDVTKLFTQAEESPTPTSSFAEESSGRQSAPKPVRRSRR